MRQDITGNTHSAMIKSNYPIKHAYALPLASPLIWPSEIKTVLYPHLRVLLGKVIHY